MTSVNLACSQTFYVVFVCLCVQIGGGTYTLQEVMTRPDLVATMTASEKAAYTELYRKAYEDLHT